jgi:N-acetylneuraminic acid mutarotase
MRSKESHGMGNVSASVLLAVTVVILSTLTGCDVKIPEGKYSCADDADCPAGWHCQDDPVTRGARRCYNSNTGDSGLPTSPTGRYYHAMATLGNKVLLFGGKNESWPLLDDTWEWDGSHWSQRFPSASPPARYWHAMATLGNKVLLFGGIHNGEPSDDTWEWDGKDWTQKFPRDSPPARSAHAMATLGDKVVLFGGCSVCDGVSTAELLTDTWEWDSSNWQQKSPSANPEGRLARAAATLGNKVLLFGGIRGSNYDMWFDSWEWDGSNWSQKAPYSYPKSRSMVAMATLKDRVLLFGGYDDNRILMGIGVLNDLWAWDGVKWDQQTPEINPPPRLAHAMATLKDKVLLFGGLDSAWNDLSDTWEWDGENWSQKE